MVLVNSKFAPSGKDLHVTTGPAVTYWNPVNMASGNYTVKATDGVYGIRFAHNTDAIVTGLSVIKQ